MILIVTVSNWISNYFFVNSYSEKHTKKQIIILAEKIYKCFDYF